MHENSDTSKAIYYLLVFGDIEEKTGISNKHTQNLEWFCNRVSAF